MIKIKLLKKSIFSFMLLMIPFSVHSESLGNQEDIENLQTLSRVHHSFAARKKINLKRADFAGSWIFKGTGAGSFDGSPLVLNFVLQAEFNRLGIGEVNYFESTLATGSNTPIFAKPTVNKVTIKIADAVNHIFTITLALANGNEFSATFIAKRSPTGKILSAYAVNGTNSGFHNGSSNIEMIRQN